MTTKQEKILDKIQAVERFLDALQVELDDISCSSIAKEMVSTINDLICDIYQGVGELETTEDVEKKERRASDKFHIWEQHEVDEQIPKQWIEDYLNRCKRFDQYNKEKHSQFDPYILGADNEGFALRFFVQDSDDKDKTDKQSTYF